MMRSDCFYNLPHNRNYTPPLGFVGTAPNLLLSMVAGHRYSFPVIVIQPYVTFLSIPPKYDIRRKIRPSRAAAQEAETIFYKISMASPKLKKRYRWATGLPVGRHHMVVACEGGDEHNQRALRQVEICNQPLHGLKLVAGVDENIRPGGFFPGRSRPARPGIPASGRTSSRHR